MPVKRHRISQSDQDMARYLAIVIRNAMEDFHCKHLSDEQMKELNPIIQNAVLTALHAVRHSHESESAKQFFEFHARCIPTYWEDPVLLEDFSARDEHARKHVRKRS